MFATVSPTVMKVSIVMIEHPYLLFLGDVTDPLSAKTASGVAHWRPELCLGQMRLKGGSVNFGLPDMQPGDAAARGVKTLLVGIANEGGYIPESWHPALFEALDAGLHIASGLHERLADIPRLAAAATEKGLRLIDVRTPPASIPVGTGEKRTGKRLLTVGTDCAVGKMYATLALEKAMKKRGLKADFRATGQTGIFIAGNGMPIDAVVSDFLSGAAEIVSPANDPDHWDLIEGQGSLFHPTYAAVTLGLIHGSQPDALVLCHTVGLDHIDGHPNYPVPPLGECMHRYEDAARLTNPAAKVMGLSFNMSRMSEAAAKDYLARTADTYQLPCFDPVRTGVETMVDALTSV